MHTFDVVTLGEMLIDMFPEKDGYKIGEVDAFIPNPGGAPANVAVAAARLDMKSAFIGKLGQDHFGTYLKKVLEDENVDTRGIRFDPVARTTMAFIAKPDKNSAEFVFYRNPGADQLLTAEELDIEMLESTRALHFCSVSLTDEPARSATFQAARIARKAGALVSYDVNYRPSLWNSRTEALEQIRLMLAEVDLVKVNEEEAAFLSGHKVVAAGDPEQLDKTARELLKFGPELLVITLGEKGSYFHFEGGRGFIPPFKVDSVDAVGCGDSFIAGLLTKLVEEKDWQSNLSVKKMKENLTFANAAGALTSLKRGVIPALPTRNEVEKFLDER
jgi:fructokinase